MSEDKGPEDKEPEDKKPDGDDIFLANLRDSLKDLEKERAQERMAAKVVAELEPGDMIHGNTLIARATHPFYRGLKLVIWVLKDGSLSLDAVWVDDSPVLSIQTKWSAK